MADIVDIANDIVQDAIDRSISKAPKFNTPSKAECIDCDEPIPMERQKVGGVIRCIDCQIHAEGR